MKKAKRAILVISLILCLALLAGCTELQITSTVRIENAQGKGTVTFDLPNYRDDNAPYLPNGSEGLKNATKEVIEGLGVAAEVTMETVEEAGDAGVIYVDHIYVTVAFNSIDEYNTIMQTLSGNPADYIPATFTYDEAAGGYVFREHSTGFTNVVNYLRVLICENENVNLSPEGHDSHSPDETANSFYEYIYVGDGTSELFRHHDYRNEAIGHTYISSVGNFAADPDNGGNDVPPGGDSILAIVAALAMSACAVFAMGYTKRKK